MNDPLWHNVNVGPGGLSGDHLLLRPEAEEGSEQPGRSRPGAAGDVRQARHLARRAEAPDATSRSTRSSTAFRWRRRFKATLAEMGIIFCSFSEAVHDHPELVREYLGSVVPYSDNYFATLNSRGLHRRLVLLHPEGRALPDGAVDLLPYQCRKHRAVRADTDHRRRRRVCQLPGRLHRADAR